jgi:uncharacterized protein (TIGR02996 family)
MGGEEEGFFRAMAAQPEDDLVRLVYADWLEENGRAERAHFIRAQMALATPERREVAPVAAFVAEDDLYRSHRACWEAALTECGATDIRWRRGMPERLSIAAADFLEHSDRLFASAPTLSELRLHHVKTSHLRRLASCPRLNQLRTFAPGELDAAGLCVLLASPHLRELPCLDLSYSRCGLAVAEAVAAAPTFHSLARLDLECGDLGADGLRALVGSLNLPKLTDLNLTDNRIGADGAGVLAASPGCEKLRHLDLTRCEIGDGGLRALARSPHLRNLTCLRVAGCLRHGYRGHLATIEAVARSPHFRSDMAVELGGWSGTFEQLQAEFLRGAGEGQGGGRGR